MKGLIVQTAQVKLPSAATTVSLQDVLKMVPEALSTEVSQAVYVPYGNS